MASSGLFKVFARMNLSRWFHTSDAKPFLWFQRKRITTGNINTEWAIASNSRDLNNSLWLKNIIEQKRLRSEVTDSNLCAFNSSFQHICEELTRQKDPILLNVAERLGSVLNYNVLGGKMARGLTLISAVQILSSSKLTPYELELTHILAWCIEILQGFFLVVDDIMDDGTTRRGKSCWFRLPEVGLQAINDAILLDCSIYQLLEKHFHKMDCYTKILNEFHAVTQKTVWGQTLDMCGNPGGKPKLTLFKPDYYQSVVVHKTAFYSFCLPVRLAMYLVSSTKKFNFSENHFTLATEICLKLGTLFQIQDDFLDAYGDKNVIGKGGNDIRQGKCTWLAVTALQDCGKENKVLMEEAYGVDNSEAVKAIMELYDSLGIKEKFYETEEKMKSEILSLITQVDDQVLKKDVFEGILNKMYKRQK